MLSDQLVIGARVSSDPANELSQPARPDADFDLADTHYDSRASALPGMLRRENPLIVGPRLRSSQVLRDTIGERFLFDQKRSLFVNEFVPRHCCSRT